ncbi:MAG TPA: 30S ribosomal protein S12 methylthiotransferase RimO [Lentimicrobium sp.]|nr:30S ribosomal protein S12 methylthiotransferase RimO [Lentimicrobium sp.]
MKTKLANHKSVNVITLGCSKNLVDSEFMMRQLKAAGFEIHHDSNNEADVIIINTCGFINDAKEESINTILHWSELRQEGKVDQLYVMGCLSERYREELVAELPEVDGIYGVNDLNQLLQDMNAPFRQELLSERIITTPSHYAYLKTSEGCDHKCAFCAIPAIRGKNISKSFETLVREAEFLASCGVRELILIAQDLTAYGTDIYGKKALPGLVNRLSEVNGIEWIRLHYAYPLGFPLELLKIIRDNPKVCKYLDIPLQHINDRILRSMKRGLNGAKTRELVEKIRSTVPGIAIRTSLIVGYPGETTEEFNELYRFVETSKFERLGVFSYSHEENTDAFKLADNVRAAVKARRTEKIMTLQQRISEEFNAAQVGKVIKVLVDKQVDGNWIARTEYDSPEVDNEVIITGKENAEHTIKPGNFVNVRITGYDIYDLFGEIIEDLNEKTL